MPELDDDIDGSADSRGDYGGNSDEYLSILVGFGLGRSGGVALPRFSDNFLAATGFGVAFVAILAGRRSRGSNFATTASFGTAILANLASRDGRSFRRIAAVARGRIDDFVIFTSLVFLKNV